jgi:hypothetical protein
MSSQTRGAFGTSDARDAKRSSDGGVALERLPRPDYRNHPAYGGAFPKPRLGLRLRALARFVPWFGLVAGKRVVLFDRLPTLTDSDGPMTGGIGRRVVAVRRYAPLIARGLVGQLARIASGAKPLSLSPDASALHQTLVRDGIAPTRFTPDEMEAIRAQLKEPERQLIERRATQKVRTFEGNQSWLNKRDARPLYALLTEVFTRHGVMATAEAYLGRPVEVKGMVLQINDGSDMYQKQKFADVGVPDPATNYMHCDTSEEIVKCIIYLTEVTESIGPFGYMRASNRIRVGPFEGLVRRANDRAGLSGYKPEVREMFMALPAALRHKSMFGSDLLDGTPESSAVVDAEYLFVSADGNAALFDNLGVHRGGLVREGERRVLIANVG